MLEQLISLMGAILILAAYAGLQTKKLRSDELLYIIANLIGSLILAYVAYRVRQTGLIVVEGSWAVISLFALVRYFQQRGQPGLNR